MQTRIAFNTGEVDENVSLRADIEAIGRSLITLENWEVSDLGGVSRRRGLKKLASAMGGTSRIFPYVYSYAEGDGFRFIVEVSEDGVRVLDKECQEVKRWEYKGFTPDGVRATQINKLMVLTSISTPPMVVKYDGAGAWEFEKYRFSTPPWRYDEARDTDIVLTESGSGVNYSVAFSEDEEASERMLYDEDMLRGVVWTDSQEVRSKANELLDGVKVVSAVPASSNVGAKYAVETDEMLTYWVCKQKFYEEVYTPGLESPGNYTTNFEKAESTDGFEGVPVVTSMYDALNNTTGNHGLTSTEDGKKCIKKDVKFAVRSSYWEYWTCIKEHNSKAAGITDFAEMKENYVRGLMCGDAVACGGAWSFVSSGLWYGEYEVRRSYGDGGVASSYEWESLGVSASAIGSPANVKLSGDEREECWLRLFVTRSMRISKNGGNLLSPGFPADSCENRLVVEGYRHDVMLRCHTNGQTTYWTREEPIKCYIGKQKSIRNWSWAAFGERYGYPLHCAVYDMRLCFAATANQPQTIWLSQPDDLINFATTNDDAGAMCLTLNTVSQNPICWLSQQRTNLLLGTSDGEFVVSSGSNGITNTNATIAEHGRIGSDGVTALSTSDKVLYVERGGWRVYEYGYDFQIDGYASTDLCVFAPHIARDHGGFVRAALTSKPIRQAAFVLGDGQVALCTYNRAQSVKAWSRWVTNGRVVDVCALPDGNAEDLLYFVVQRQGEVNIEVYRSDNEYIDEGGWDYESVLVTPALENPIENAVQKGTKKPYYVRLGADYEYQAGNMLISGDRKNYAQPDKVTRTLARGWHNMITLAGVDYEHYFCMRVKGDKGITILAIQG